MRFFASTSLLLLIGVTSLYAGTSKLQSSYQVLATNKVGGDGGFDYVNCDPAARRLYVARRGQPSRVDVFDLDSIAPVGKIDGVGAHGAVVDDRYNHGFCSSSPITMFDSNTLAVIKKIDVQGNPDGMLEDPYNHRVYVLSHQAPNITVLDAKDGAVLGTIDLGGAPEQAATDGRGHIYVDIEDKGTVGVIDAKTMKLTGTFDLAGKGAGNAGLALDPRNHVLFVACREPSVMVMISSVDGHFLGTAPIGRGCDGVVFNPKTNEAFSSQGDGTLTVIKENSPTDFVVEQTVTTPVGAKTCTLDPKTGKVFLITASYEPAPAPAAGAQPGRFRRGPMIPGSFAVVVVGKPR